MVQVWRCADHYRHSRRHSGAIPFGLYARTGQWNDTFERYAARYHHMQQAVVAEEFKVNVLALGVSIVFGVLHSSKTIHTMYLQRFFKGDGDTLG